LFGQLETYQLLLLVFASMGIGLSKSGFPGVGLFHVVVFANVFEARQATGLLLPLLIVGDLCAIGFFGKRAQWHHIRRMLPPTIVGICIGWLLMKRIDDATFRPLVGGIILVLTGLQLIRMWRPNLFENLPHQPAFAWTLGLLAGITTMLANAAGPVMALYMVAVCLPKFELVGTGAWFFLVVNLLKLPFSFELDLISAETLGLNAMLAPAIIPGMLAGRWLIKRISQKTFDSLLLVLTSIAALRLVGLF
jgi:uncharacterized protein